MSSDFDTLKDAYPGTFAAVSQCLREQLGSPELTDSEDFDRDGILFRATLPSSDRVRIFVSHEFLSDFDKESAVGLIKRWHVPSKAKSLPKGQILMVTTQGAFVEGALDQPHLIGHTLREAAGIFERVLPSNDALRDLQKRVFGILVDGTPLGDIPTKFAGHAEYYSRYSDEFADLVGSAYLLDAAGYRGFSLHRVSKIPELEVTFGDGGRVFLEFVRVVIPREQHAADVREYVNGALRRLTYTDPELSGAMEGHFVSIQLPDAELGKRQRDEMISEIATFVKDGSMARTPRQSITRFTTEFPLLSALDAAVYVADGVTSLSVQDSAKSFDPYEPLRRIADIVRTKSSIRYTASPVWLGISLAEYAFLLPPFDIMDARRVPEVDIEKTPFEKILVGSAGLMIDVYERKHNSDEGNSDKSHDSIV